MVYYGFYVLAIALAAGGYWLTSAAEPVIDERSTAGIVLASAYMLALVVSIPFALWWFNRKVKQIAADTALDEDEKAARYQPVAMMRLLIVGLGLLAGIAMFYLTRSRSMIYCAAMAAMILVYCKPSELKMSNELAGPLPEEEA